MTNNTFNNVEFLTYTISKFSKTQTKIIKMKIYVDILERTYIYRLSYYSTYFTMNNELQDS